MKKILSALVAAAFAFAAPAFADDAKKATDDAVKATKKPGDDAAKAVAK